MAALVEDGYSAGDAIRNAQLQFIAAGIAIDGQEQEAAIAFAGGRGWIANGLRAVTIQPTQLARTDAAVAKFENCGLRGGSILSSRFVGRVS